MSAEYTILVQLQADFAGENAIQSETLEIAASKVLETEGIEGDAMLTIVLATNSYVQEMNEKYRAVDAPTDVLSFPASPLPDEIADEDSGYLGDIIISLPYVAERAKEENHSLHDDLTLMVVHGVLHLLGYDHDTPDSQKAMWVVQDKILKSLGVMLEVPDFIHDEESH